MKDTHYIFTEIVNCGKIGRIALDSFHKYHNYKVHIFGTKADFEWIIPNANNVFAEVDDEIVRGFQKGHVGTALIWERVIRNCEPHFVIHFDSDVVFRGNIIDFMIERSREYDIVGPIRNYHHNPNQRDDVRFLADLCQTCCILFNKRRISSRYIESNKRNPVPSREILFSLSIHKIVQLCRMIIKERLFLRKSQLSILARMIHGTYNPFNFGVIDFFDPIMFHMIMNGARIFHLDPDEVGGFDKYGRRDNKYKEINDFPSPYKIDFGSKIAHFSCVGSGMNFYAHRDISKIVGDHYFQSAVDRYCLFSKIFYDEEMPDFDVGKYSSIVEVENWY